MLSHNGGLLDIGLPDVDGLEVAGKMRDPSGGGWALVILISSRDVAYGDLVAAGLAPGYLPKHELSMAASLDVAGQAP